MGRRYVLVVFFLLYLANSKALCQNVYNQILREISLDLFKRNNYDSIKLTVEGLGVSPIDRSIVVCTSDSLNQKILNFRRLEKDKQVEILFNKHFPIFPLADTLHIVDSLKSFDEDIVSIYGHSFLFEFKNSSQSTDNVIFLENMQIKENHIILVFLFPNDKNLRYGVMCRIMDTSAIFYKSDFYDMRDIHYSK